MIWPFSLHHAPRSAGIDRGSQYLVPIYGRDSDSHSIARFKEFATSRSLLTQRVFCQEIHSQGPFKLEMISASVHLVDPISPLDGPGSRDQGLIEDPKVTVLTDNATLEIFKHRMNTLILSVQCYEFPRRVSTILSSVKTSSDAPK